MIMVRTLTYLVFAGFCFTFVNSDNAVHFSMQKKSHKAQELTDENIQDLAALTDTQHLRKVLNQILIPRVVGTPDHEKVANFIGNEMKTLGWNVEEDVFSDTTPVFGVLKFRNIIATLNPKADRYLVLACHYDSKYTREHVFVGATDSAVPCAMLINLAKVMSEQLSAIQQNDLSLMFIFFDGEEAFRQWGPKDSLYGARHLAQKWQDLAFKDGANQLQRMDVLVLLDLLGAPDPVFYSYFQSTERWYIRVASAEQRLAQLALLAGYSAGRAEQTYFRLRSSGSHVEDDHVPFLRRNVGSRPTCCLAGAGERRAAEQDNSPKQSVEVEFTQLPGTGQLTGNKYFKPIEHYNRTALDDHVPFLERNVDILHMIPNPFPQVWHKKEDDITAVDFDTVENLNKILRVFVAEYLHTPQP